MVFALDLDALELLPVVLYYGVFFRSLSLGPLVQKALNAAALPVCHQDLVLVFDVKLGESGGPAKYLPQLGVGIVYALEFLFDVALVLRVHVLAATPAGPDVGLEQALHAAAVHVGLQDLVLLLECQGLHLVPDDLAQLGVALVDHQELLINQLLLVLFHFLLVVVHLVVIGRWENLLLLALFFLEDVVVLAPRVLGGLLVLVLLLVVEVVAEVVVDKQAIVFLLLLGGESRGVEDYIWLLLNGLQDDLLVFLIVFEGRLDRPVEEVWLRWLWLDSCLFGLLFNRFVSLIILDHQ